MGEIIVVTSGKGGVGKTTTTANIGAGLSRLGKKVLVIDTDLGLRNLDVVMGLENRIVYNLVDVIEGGCRLKQAMISDKRHENLYLLPSEATYLLWLDCSQVTETGTKLVEEIREKSGLYLTEGEEYGACGRQFIRMNTACPRERLRDGLNRLASCFGDNK